MVLAFVVLAAMTACVPATVQTSTAPDDAATHAWFGVPAIPAPSGFTYQPDVVVVGGGHNAVLSGSANGLVWTLDAHAPGVDQLKTGDVLYATAYVTGRVVSLVRGADTVRATIAPVPITDVIRDGRIKVSSGLVGADVHTQTTADQGWSAKGAAASSGSATPAVVIHPASAVIQADGPSAATSWQKPDPGLNMGQDASFNGYDVSSTWAPNGVNVTVAKNLSTVKVAIDFGLKWDRLRFSSDTSISDGKVTSSHSSLTGLQAVTVTMTGGAASPAASIPRFRIELPWTTTVPINEAPPMVVQGKISLILGATFGGANATISAGGEYGLNGGIGNDGKQHTGFTVIKSLVQSINGISLAPSAIVVGMSLRVLVGLGVPGIAVGPYTKLGIVAAIANGSALGAPLVRCHSATLDINGAVGVAFDLEHDFASDLPAGVQKTRFGKYLKKLTTAASAWAEVSNSIVTRTVTIPDVPLCKGT